MDAEITQRDWAALASAYGEVLAEVLVYRRVCHEQVAEIELLRQQLAACADALHQSDRQEGGT